MKFLVHLPLLTATAVAFSQAELKSICNCPKPVDIPCPHGTPMAKATEKARSNGQHVASEDEFDAAQWLADEVKRQKKAKEMMAKYLMDWEERVERNQWDRDRQERAEEWSRKEKERREENKVQTEREKDKVNIAHMNQVDQSELATNHVEQGKDDKENEVISSNTVQEGKPLTPDSITTVTDNEQVQKVKIKKCRRKKRRQEKLS